MKKGLVIILLVLFSYSSHAQCWQTLNYCSGIKIDGSLWSWGFNEYGRVGNGTNTFVSQPVRVGTDIWKSVSGIQTVVGVKSNGTLWAWGKNDMGIMLGNTTTSNSNIPIQIGSANDWKIAVADTGGNFLCMAIKLDGTLWAWGQNQYGNLGDGTTINRNMPVQVGTANNWKSVSVGYRALALKTDGTIWQWGLCLDNIIRTSPQQVGTDNNWASAKMSPYTAHGLKNDGTLWVWGSLVGEYGLGDGNENNYRILPGQVGTDNDWAVAGIRTGIKSNGTLWAWGENMYGFHGTGSTISLPYPTQVGTDNDWIDTYEANEQFGTRLKSNGNIWTAGIHDHNFTDTPYVGIEQYLMHIVPTTACPSVLPIIANDDAGNVYSGLGGTAVANVLSNDTYNNVPATTSNVLLTEISLPNRGITLNTATGEIVVSSTMRVGIYTIIYQICAANSALNCDTATVTITVKPQTIEAVNDDFSTTPIDYLNPQITASVLSNDLLNNALISYSQVNITLTNDGGATGAWILPSGEIGVPAGTNRGTYIMEYRICDLNNSLRCDIATVIIKVAERTIETPVLEFAIRANSTVYQSEIQSTGKIITIGAFTKYNNIPAVRIARLNTNLTLDTSFLSTGPFPETEGIGRIAIQPDNKILLIGTFDSFNGSQSGKRIARLNADGTPDLTFNSGGTGFGQNDTPRSIALQNDGKILIGGGWIRTYNGVSVENMIRLNSDGTLDTTFNFPYTYQADARSSIFTILVQPDGKIIVGGNLGHTTYSRTPPNYIPILITQGQPNLFRLNTNGSIDNTFAVRELKYIDYSTTCSNCQSPIQSLLLQPDGKIIVAGIFSGYGKYTVRNIFRITDNGSIDGSFSASNSSDKGILDVILEPSGKLIIAGEFNSYRGVAQAKLARINSNGTLDTTFSSGTGPTYNDPSIFTAVHDLFRQSDSKVIVGGNFTHYNGISATNITRIAPEVVGGQAKNGLQQYMTEKEIDSETITFNETTIYPNPSNGKFLIDLTHSVENFNKVEIYNMIGQHLFSKKLTSETTNEIDLSNLSAGNYMAKISSATSSIQKILIKK